MNKRYPLFCGSLVLFGFTLSACTVSLHDNDHYNARTHFHKTIAPSGALSIRIGNVSGRINVLGSNRPDVDVDATVSASDNDALKRITVSVDRIGDEIRVRTTYPTTFLSFGPHGRVDYTVRIPGSLAVNASDVDGTVLIAGVNADVSAVSISGDVTANTNAGNLNLKSTSGTIVGAVRELTPKSQLTAASVSGDILFKIPKHAGASISAHSVSGDFSTNLGLPKTNQTVGTTVNANLNGGGAKISFSTVSGSISLNGI